MKILIIMPRYGLTKEKNYVYEMPLGLSYISAVLKKKMYDINTINLNHLKGGVGEIVTGILNKTKYDYVLTGGFGVSYGIIEKIISIGKAGTRSVYFSLLLSAGCSTEIHWSSMFVGFLPSIE